MKRCCDRLGKPTNQLDETRYVIGLVAIVLRKEDVPYGGRAETPPYMFHRDIQGATDDISIKMANSRWSKSG